MRLCILTEVYPAVTETFVCEPARWLAARGHEVSVVARSRGQLAPNAEDVLPARYAPPVSPRQALVRRALTAPMATGSAVCRAWALRNILKSGSSACADSLIREIRRADFLLAHFGPAGLSWLPAAAIARRPFAVYFHGYDATRLLREQPDRYARLFASGAALLTNSRFLRERLIGAGAPAGRVAIVPLGVDPSVASEPARARGFRIVTVARLVPKKGLPIALSAFAALRRASGDPWEYEIIGDGTLRQELGALADRLGVGHAVRFRGVLSHRATLDVLREAAIFLLASHGAESGDTEGTPVALLEAASLGLPVVATRHAGIPEILPPEGQHEFLAPERDEAALADVLIRTASSEALRRAWGEACAQWVRPRHSADAHVTALTDALQRHARIPELPRPGGR